MDNSSTPSNPPVHTCIFSRGASPSDTSKSALIFTSSQNKTKNREHGWANKTCQSIKIGQCGTRPREDHQFGAVMRKLEGIVLTRFCLF
ncbi:hypothetical protein COCSUDRAFT_32037 [Coccomyxa subellipsoidea C-169]|uniref:Uncharacterized protein n=1 Tax=Coccomyxa subellipsoidea (strain C-169) TaxID=574566 RepID=I0ZA74_COCSC|nr:hypothetical protein COCSUDRAFT_32037 [Coccomyxa subellipsoidea C-169]EIE27543.1 hypothetical protein COCSUDRAFT_32037 [Coccomyxa subellipsoidea C-169]|eukprot:XP_005652087.1 hypothetical protein COCSUDRAFT_32037 [Coccomyxa subellipsoidea C-169]